MIDLTVTLVTQTTTILVTQDNESTLVTIVNEDISNIIPIVT